MELFIDKDYSALARYRLSFSTSGRASVLMVIDDRVHFAMLVERKAFSRMLIRPEGNGPVYEYVKSYIPIY